MQLHDLGGGEEAAQFWLAPPSLPRLFGNNADATAKRAMDQVVRRPERGLTGSAPWPGQFIGHALGGFQGERNACLDEVEVAVTMTSVSLETS